MLLNEKGLYLKTNKTFLIKNRVDKKKNEKVIKLSIIYLYIIMKMKNSCILKYY